MADNIIPVATLSSKGYVRGTTLKADQLIVNAFTTDKLQSVLYSPDAITSIPWTIAQYGNDEVRLAKELNDLLLTYFSRYYTNPIVEVNAGTSPEELATKRFTYYIYVRVTDGDNSISIGYLMRTENSKLSQYVKMANNAL